jgi:hypothetical protein
MGIDVLGSFQAKVEGKWVFQKEYYNGQRGMLRWWLGWGSGEFYEKFRVEPLVDELRGLPLDLKNENAREATYQSWVSAEEVLSALPLLGWHSYSVPHELVRKTLEQAATPAQWKTLTGITDELDFLENYGGPPRLLSVTPDGDALSHEGNCVEVKVTFDFSDWIMDFVTILNSLRQLHEEVRFVYEFG